MSLANLLDLSKDNLVAWSLQHQQQHQAIIQQIYVTYGYELTLYPLDPIVDLNGIWGEWHQQMHDDFCGVLNIAGNDYSSLALDDKSRLENWTLLHFEEHQTANGALGVE
jgi:hypothetical protein